MEISVVIPVYNSAPIIEELYSRISNSLKNVCEFEIIFVNDCSVDNSWEKITDLTLKNNFIAGINFQTPSFVT